MSDLTKAIRQCRHNDSDEFVIVYDKEETEKVVYELMAQVEFKVKECQELAQACNRYKNQLRGKKIHVLTELRDAIKPDGLINSAEGTKTIMAITNAINKIINSEIELTQKYAKQITK